MGTGGRIVRIGGPIVSRPRYDSGVVEITFLLWDEQNIAHIARHGVMPAEVEEVVFLGTAVFVEAVNPTRPGRIIAFGLTITARPLAVFLDTPTAVGAAYVVTARPMGAKERRTYRNPKETS